jgi:hypothetical protein
MGPSGTDGLDLAQDATASVARLTDEGRLEHTLDEGRGGYLYAIDGVVVLNDAELEAGDAAKIAGPAALTLRTGITAELI